MIRGAARALVASAAVCLPLLVPATARAQGVFERLTPETHRVVHMHDPNLSVFPAYFSPWDFSRAIEFKTKGAYDNGSWFIIGADNYASHEEDHVLAFSYNGKWSPGFGWFKPEADSHWLRMGYESRFVFEGDPAVKRGFFEWNLDIDPNVGNSVPGDISRAWGFIYDMDARRTELYIGDPLDPNSGFAFLGGGHGFWANRDIIRFADRSLAGISATDINSQGRIVLDPGGRGSTADRAVMIRNMNADLDIAPGIRSDGVTTGRMFIGRHRITRVVIGHEPFTPQRFMIDGQDDQIQFRIRGHLQQTQNLMTLEKNDGTDVVTVSGPGQLGVSGLGIEFNESDANPGCATGSYNIYADASETEMKVCNNGRTGDIPTSLSVAADIDVQTPAGFSRCSPDVVVPVTGAAEGDTISLGIPPSSVVTGGQYMAWVSAANFVSIRHCCFNTACPDPGAGNFKIRVWKP